jgi:hypothetical protein
MARGGKILLSTTFGVFLFAVSWPLVSHGSPDFVSWDSALPHRQDVIESLQSPRRLSSWSLDGLHTVKGEIITLPGIEVLPEQSPILDEIVHRCVEVDPDDGRVYGLLPILHNCGNDPVAFHLARVDVADVLRFVSTDPDCNSIGNGGWDDYCFYKYEQSMEPK